MCAISATPLSQYSEKCGNICCEHCLSSGVHAPYDPSVVESELVSLLHRLIYAAQTQSLTCLVCKQLVARNGDGPVMSRYCAGCSNVIGERLDRGCLKRIFAAVDGVAVEYGMGYLMQVLRRHSAFI